MKSSLLLLLCSFLLSACALSSSEEASLNKSSVSLSSQDKEKIAHAIWKNECAGTIEGLTSWNVGENFPSLGIGHFIWYPEGRRGIYEESFPSLIAYAQQVGVRPPSGVSAACPWTSREAFLAAKNSPLQKELRTWLAQNTLLQVNFIIQRSHAALGKMLAKSTNPQAIKQKYKALTTTPQGMYALIDYVNFKGEGTQSTERYQGQGWGLLQVLEAMPTPTPTGARASEAFSQAAKKVLTKRVELSPPARGEKRWLAGWLSRCETYKKAL